MRPAKIRFGLAVDGAGWRNSQFVDEDALDVGTHDATHGVDEDPRPVTFGRVAQVGGDGLLSVGERYGLQSKLLKKPFLCHIHVDISVAFNLLP